MEKNSKDFQELSRPCGHPDSEYITYMAQVNRDQVQYGNINLLLAFFELM